MWCSINVIEGRGLGGETIVARTYEHHSTPLVALSKWYMEVFLFFKFIVKVVRMFLLQLLVNDDLYINIK